MNSALHQQWLAEQADQAVRQRLLAQAAPQMLDVLRTTAANIRSLRAAGTGNVVTFDGWLAVVEQAIAAADGRP